MLRRGSCVPKKFVSFIGRARRGRTTVLERVMGDFQLDHSRISGLNIYLQMRESSELINFIDCQGIGETSHQPFENRVSLGREHRRDIERFWGDIQRG